MLEKMFVEALTNGLVSAGFPCLLLGFGLWWMNRFMTKQMGSSEARQTEFITALNEERKSHIDQIERQNEVCEKDRASLRQQLIDLLKEDRTVIRTLPPAQSP